MHLLGLFLLLSCLPSTLVDFALPQWVKDPNLKIEDTYKWIYQATRGGEHAVPSTEMAQKYLDEEWRGLSQATDGEALWQPLCADGSIGRLNLRPFRDRGGNENNLAEAFVRSSQNFKGEAADFLDAWNEFGERLKKKQQGRLNYPDWKTLDKKMKKQKYPAIHHSRFYEQAEHPAYRILTKDEADKLISALK